MSPTDAACFNVKNGDKVSVAFKTERAGVLDDVDIRVDENFTLEMHLDTDEANSLGIAAHTDGVVIKL